MSKFFFKLSIVALIPLLFTACNQKQEESSVVEVEAEPKKDSVLNSLLNKYTTVRLTTDVTTLSENQKQMIPMLIEVGEIMDELFWFEAYGHKDSLISTLDNDAAKKFVKINYGPWDRLNGNKPFIEGVGYKPAGANYYPVDMTKEEFEAANIEDKTSLYTFIRRDSTGELTSIPFHVMFEEQVKKASDLLKKAAELADNAELKKYLNLRAEALLTDNYYESDIAWMDMKTNQIDIITGPIETYEDQLYGYKAAHETYVLVKDMEWSKRLAKYATLLPELQKGLPVDDKYKKEKPGTDSQLAAFDVIYYAGDCNAGSKTIAVNLPNDEEVQLKKGTRRSQLKNAMKAKFDEILVPISKVLIDEEQQKHITFDAFFANTMFHEVAHGLGIKNTINGKTTVREALKEHASALEEGKADVLGLYMITKLHENGEIEGELMDYYTTFMASIFRSVRFGASSAHGKANMVRFNYFKDQGAFTKDEQKGTYKINFGKMQEAMNSLSEKILTLQGDGDYEGVKQLVDEKALIKPELQRDLDELSKQGIPVDIVFEQGVEVLGL
ncbi:Zn-dependent hydrolase [Fulvivirga sp. 29W222]|uniref:Zn-dependent hydrolase n=1 Tax=Fulvivirga marina TaxID=2494733 RepID=A0A937FT34_9BACT|nr:Zn-dependent hydrolase [Fulvivirga marina]MBL6445060.1 Zn-dependent hydrolase [Fulvivirga marina]